jgi:hypothetical protein
MAEMVAEMIRPESKPPSTENKMKKNVTYIDASKFEAIILSSGLPMAGQKGFVKVQGPAGYAVYVAATKRVGRVDISGFEVPYGVEPHCGPFGNVKQQLDFSKTEDEVLADFTQLLKDLAAQQPKEKKERRAAAPKADAPKGWTKVEADLKEQRKATIAAKAKKKQTDGAIQA